MSRLCNSQIGPNSAVYPERPEGCFPVAEPLGPLSIMAPLAHHDGKRWNVPPRSNPGQRCNIESIHGINKTDVVGKSFACSCRVPLRQVRF